MNGFMITPIGITVIAVYSFAILMAALFLSRLMPKFRWKWALLAPPAALLLSLPWAEEAWISWHFKEACKDAGVTVYRQVEVEGYVDDSSRSSRKSVTPGLWTMDTGSLISFDRAGYKFTENMLEDGGVLRVERHPNGLMATVLDLPSARYQLKYTYQPSENSHEEPIGWKLEKVERQVIDSQTGEILGRQIHVNRGLPIYEAWWVQSFGGAMVSCPSPNAQPYVPPPPFPQAVLKPISK